MALTKTTVEMADTVLVPAGTDGVANTTTNQFSSAGRDFAGMAGQVLEVLDAGSGTATAGEYIINSVEANTQVVTLNADPTTGTNATGVDFSVKYTTSDTNFVDAYGGSILTLRVANGATGPTISATSYFQVGVDEDNDGDADSWYDYAGKFDIKVANSGIQGWVFEVPAAAEWVRGKLEGHTGQSVTLEMWAVKVTEL